MGVNSFQQARQVLSRFPNDEDLWVLATEVINELSCREGKEARDYLRKITDFCLRCERETADAANNRRQPES